ncbi:MAG: DUF2207 domain-containing protein [Firmicutes bacterium]|nr:DUF2207 domain-containing protein [Bacillota bacterium]
MISIVNIYTAVIYGYYLFFIGLIAYLYWHYSKSYEPEKLYNYTNTIPAKLSPIELSILVNNKITPQALTATVYFLVANKALIKSKEKKEIYLYRNLNYKGKLSHSQKYVIKLLIDIIGNGERVAFTNIEKFCVNNKGATSFLLNYEIWRRMAISEGSKKNFFEPKKHKHLVNWFSVIGLVLFLINILFSLKTFLGYFLLLPALFILYYYRKIFRRTKKYNEQFYQWLEFSSYLKNIKQLGFEKENIHLYLMYSIVLDKIEYVEPHLLKSEEFVKLNSYIKKSYKRAYFHGSRSL